MGNIDYINIMNQLNIKQMILQGPPGTSKTYSAKRIIAKEFAKNENLTDKEPEGFLEKAKLANRWDIVQFHPSYCYEDFVRGITVSTRRNNVVYKTVNKVFGKMCKLAASDSDKPYFLIIDEINRADLAAVFGELIYALEYRGESVSIPYEIYGNSTLTVPNNLYIIGTMNTADRSVGTIDYAVRRRFLFFDLLPDEDVLKNFYNKARDAAKSTKEKAIDCFNKINKFIEESINTEYRAEDFKIGHTYFMVKNEGDLANRLRYQVLPILREYVIDGIIQKKDNVFNEPIRKYLYEGTLSPNDNYLINGIISYGKQQPN